MNAIYRFFCWAGGGNIAVLKELPTEQNRFFGYGTVICMTALFALLSSLYAFYLLFFEQLGYFIILPALAWALFIFVLDRFFISTISNRGTVWRRIQLALPRLILAVFIGVIISKPLEFRIFDREINGQLRETINLEVKKLDTVYQQRMAEMTAEEKNEIARLPASQQISGLNERINSWQGRVDTLNRLIIVRGDSMNAEFAARGASALPGAGTHWKHHQLFQQRMTDEQDTLHRYINNTRQRIDGITDSLNLVINGPIAAKYKTREDSVTKEISAQQAAIRNNYNPSILNEQTALENLAKNDPTASYTIWFITSLFIFIEMAPMLLKIMTSASAYEGRLAQVEAGYGAEDRLRRSLDMEEYKSNRGLVRRLARSQRSIVDNAIDQWRKDQMDKLRDDPTYFTNLFKEDEHDNDNHK